MDTALVTGMFETSFLPNTQVRQDVKEGSAESFGKFLESSLKNNDVVKNETKDCEKIKDVVHEKPENNGTAVDEENVQDVNNAADDIDEEEGNVNKKDKKTKKDNNLNDFASQNDLASLLKKDEPSKDVEFKEVITEDVENTEVIKLVGVVKNDKLELAPEKKLDDLLNKLDVKLNQNVKIKDDCEKVIEVGPQSVETEKIELNIKDVKNKIIQGNNDASKGEKVDIPMIQNPFKLKRLSEENENAELSQEILPENIEDVKKELLELADVKNALESENVESNKLTTDIGSKKDVDEKVDDRTENKAENNTEDYLIKNDVSHSNLTENDFNSKDESDDSNNKEDKIKIKDFRNKKEVDFKQEVFSKNDVKTENKFEIKEVNNIKNFDKFVEQDVLDQVTEKLEVSLFDNKSEMVIKLKPNDLGKVTVKISIENGVMNAKFLADSIKVKETLESNLNNLKESLKEQGINVQDLSVSVDSGKSQNNQTFNQNNLVYLNNKTNLKNDKVVNYEDTYYEFSDINNNNNVKNYWLDSTVSFLA